MHFGIKIINNLEDCFRECQKNERNRPNDRTDCLLVFGKYPPTYKMKIDEFYPFKPNEQLSPYHRIIGNKNNVKMTTSTKSGKFVEVV